MSTGVNLVILTMSVLFAVVIMEVVLRYEQKNEANSNVLTAALVMTAVACFGLGLPFVWIDGDQALANKFSSQSIPANQ